MSKRVYLALLGFFLGGLLAHAMTAYSAGPSKPSDKTIVLSKENTVAFHGVVDYASVRDAQRDLISLSHELSRHEPIYLFLDTPGGSIEAGLELINTVKGLPQEVKTITNFAASMGFVFAQHMGERLVLPTGTLMSHRAYIGEEGQIPGEFNTRVNFWMGRIEGLERNEAARLGITYEAYRNLVQSEYWVSGKKAVEQKAADRVVTARCDKDLSGTHKQALMTMFGPVDLTWSDCPLITTPLAIDFSNIESNYYNSLEVENLKRTINRIYTDKTSFARSRESWSNYFKYLK